MGHAYAVKDQGAVYFVTFTVHQWVDVFTRKEYAKILIESLRYCQKHKGLDIFAWVIMSNHCHLIVRARENNLSDIIRDFKKFTSKEIYKAIEDHKGESRREWLMMLLKHNDKIWFWEEGYHGEEIMSLEFYTSKVDYIHLNPVRGGIVEKEEEYLWSSAADFHGTRKGVLELTYYG